MNFKRICAAVVTVSVSSVSFAIWAMPAHADTTPVTVVVDTKTQPSTYDEVSLQKSSDSMLTKAISPSQLVFDTTKGEESNLLAAARKIDSAATLEESGESHLDALPNDPCVTSCVANGAPWHQWGLADVNAPAAWNKSTGSPSVTVAVVDAGVNASVPELAGKVVGEIDEIPGIPRVSKMIDHGTEVASIIAANTNNSIGIAGMAWNVKILSVRVVDQNGNANDADVAQGIRDAANAGASIINVSLGSPVAQTFVADAVDYAEAKGALVVASAGNTQMENGTVDLQVKDYPAAFPNVLSVSGVDRYNDNDKEFASGSWVNIYAPGDAVLGISASDAPTVISGSSFATPMVSGVAALIKSKYPNVMPDAIQAMIKTSAHTVVGLQTHKSVPLLDANAAIAAPSQGYWMVASDGLVRNEGTTARLGFPKAVTKPIVGMAGTPSGNGYWLVGSDGGIFNFGGAKFYGSTGALTLNKPIVAMAPTPTGKGYWLVASDGGIFTFGDAKFYGSTGNIALNKPIVGMAATSTGKGYWLVASDGGIFTFGDAKFYGSAGSVALKKPIVAMTTSDSGQGYWLVGADGNVFSYGDAKAYGTGIGRVDTNVTTITRTKTGAGYWLLSSSGRVFAFGDARQWGQNYLPTNRCYVGIVPAS